MPFRTTVMHFRIAIVDGKKVIPEFSRRMQFVKKWLSFNKKNYLSNFYDDYIYTTIISYRDFRFCQFIDTCHLPYENGLVTLVLLYISPSQIIIRVNHFVLKKNTLFRRHVLNVDSQMITNSILHIHISRISFLFD